MITDLHSVLFTHGKGSAAKYKVKYYRHKVNYYLYFLFHCTGNVLANLTSKIDSQYGCEISMGKCEFY